MRTGLLYNPLSGRLRGRSPAAVLAADGTMTCREATLPREIAAGLESFLERDMEVIAVAGGDGTVHAVLDYLFSVRPVSSWPLLAIIPAGTTNMTALDLGIRGRPLKVMRRLNLWRREQTSDPPLRRRAVIRIQEEGQAPVHGMFFGAGAIASGVRYFRERIRHLGVTGELAGGLAIAASLAKLAFRRGNGVLAPVPLAFRNAAGEAQEGRYRAFLASSLNRLLLGMRPYWGSEAAPIHVTAVGDRPERFWCSLPLLIAGRGARLCHRAGYTSYNTSGLELDLEGDFVIDGELYRASGPISLTATEPVPFLVP